MTTDTPPMAAELIDDANRVLADTYSNIHEQKMARHILATVRADDDHQLTPEALRAMGASGGPREFWFTLNSDTHDYINENRIDVDFTSAEEWEVWAVDRGDGDVVCIAINPTVGKLRSLLKGLSMGHTLNEGSEANGS